MQKKFCKGDIVKNLENAQEMVIDSYQVGRKLASNNLISFFTTEEIEPNGKLTGLIWCKWNEVDEECGDYFHQDKLVLI